MRQTAVFPVNALPELKTRLLHWAQQFPVAMYLDSNGHADRHSEWECLVAAGAHDAVEKHAGSAFPALKDFWTARRDWCFGFLGYDLKNELETLASRHPDRTGFPDLYFFQPRVVAGVRNGQLEVHSLDESPLAVYEALMQRPVPPDSVSGAPDFRPRMPKNEYLATVDALRRHIIDGDVYEVNLCQEFFAEHADIDPAAVFARVNELARAPFSAFSRLGHRYLLCASPERFLKKKGDRLLTQPIKGTRRRGSSPNEDAQIRAELLSSEKDRAENVMIVDLVRNDLARHCLPGTVMAEELFGIYSFETVHQMISTVSGRLRPDADGFEALRDAFPMGSMTGAPKVMAMELIERYEYSRRGLYSGAVGYMTPEGDFDFNVVIRSLFYNKMSRYLSVQVGGAIVYDSVPEEEYDECLVKAEAMLRYSASFPRPTSAPRDSTTNE
ncbi:MAG: anthranilate synthase component I family protein [Saprospiraceae bacterium]